MLRRDLLTRTGIALAAGALGSSPGWSNGGAKEAPFNPASESGWEGVRSQFALSDEYIHMSAMLIASHPRPVRDAIEAHRRAIDQNPLMYVFENNRELQTLGRTAAARYLGLDASAIALTDSTTMGLALSYARSGDLDH